MDKIAILKKAVSTIVGIGVSKIVTGIIENNVDTDTTINKVTVTSAGVALGYAAADATSTYTDNKIDEAVEFFKKLNAKNAKK